MNQNNRKRMPKTNITLLWFWSWEITCLDPEPPGIQKKEVTIPEVTSKVENEERSVEAVG